MKIAVFLIMLWSLASWADTQDDIKALKKRIEELEARQEQLYLSTAEPRTDVHSYINDNLTFGGFFETGYNFIAGEDTKTQWVNDANYLGINLAADLGRKFRFVSQFITATLMPLENQHNDPDAGNVNLPARREYNQYTTFSLVSQGYVEYTFNRKFILQGGIGYVPFGYALQLREPVLYVRRGGPQLVRNPNTVSIFWSGLHLYGSDYIGKNEVGYDLYTFTPVRDSKFAGVGGRLRFTDPTSTFHSGVSAQIAENDNETFKTLGADVRIDMYPFQIRSEFLDKLTHGQDSWSAYLEPGIFVFEEEVLLYAFGDYLYGAANETGSGRNAQSDPIQVWEYGFGFNWLPTSLIRIRLGFTQHDYVGNGGSNRDYFSTDTSVGVAF